MWSRGDAFGQKGGVCIDGTCKDFIKNFCFVPALKV